VQWQTRSDDSSCASPCSESASVEKLRNRNLKDVQRLTPSDDLSSASLYSESSSVEMGVQSTSAGKGVHSTSVEKSAHDTNHRSSGIGSYDGRSQQDQPLVAGHVLYTSSSSSVAAGVSSQSGDDFSSGQGIQHSLSSPMGFCPTSPRESTLRCG